MKAKKSLGNQYAQFLAPRPVEDPDAQDPDVEDLDAEDLNSVQDSQPELDTAPVSAAAPVLPKQTKQKARKPTAKSKDPNYIQTSVYLPKSLHIKLRLAAMEEEKDLSVLLAELGKQWLQERGVDI